MKRAIPLIDLGSFVHGAVEERASISEAVGDAFHSIGFVGIVNHGIDQDLIDKFYASANAFFNLPADLKRQYEIAGLAGQRGYTSFGKEHAKHSDVGDLKEFFQIGQTVTDGDPVAVLYPDNVSVKEVSDFLDSGVELYAQFEKAGNALLEAIAMYLKIGEQYFADKTHNGNSILRAIHYPPITFEPESAIRAEQHEDINLITLLVGASAGGLQILDPSGEWLPILPGEGEIVVNVGDMLQRLTNNYLVSTTHRVVNPPREEWHLPRLSIPFFLHPRLDMDLTCIDSCVDDAHPLQYSPITAGEYLNERLAEIGLKR